MKRLEKLKIPALYVLSFLLNILPPVLYFFINSERYIKTTPERVKLLFGGILLIAVLVLKTLGFLKIKSLLLFFGGAFVLSYLLNSIIMDLMVFSLLAFVGEALSSVVKVIIVRLKKDEDEKKTESIVKSVINTVSGRV